jgi:hypothetical protein
LKAKRKEKHSRFEVLVVKKKLKANRTKKKSRFEVLVVRPSRPSPGDHKPKLTKSSITKYEGMNKTQNIH